MIRGDPGQHRPALEWLVSLVFEEDLAIGGFLAGKSALMNEVVMVSAEQYEVIQARFAAIGPVFDVVSVDKSGVCAAREATTSVSTDTTS